MSRDVILSRHRAIALCIASVVLGCNDTPVPDGSGGGTGSTSTSAPDASGADASTLDGGSTGTTGDDVSGCPPLIREGSIMVSNDEDLEALRGVTEITEDLGISGAVTSLEPLECLERVHGRFEISQTPLVDLAGLESYSTGFWITIRDNPQLTSLAGFGVDEVQNLLYIENNPKLEVARLSELRSAGTVVIGNCEGPFFTGNETLSEVDLPSIAEGEGVIWLRLAGNPALESIDTVLAHSASIGRLDLMGNESLDGPAAAVAWVEAGNPADRVETCENLGDTAECDCPGGR